MRVMKPLLAEAKAAGADLLVECTTIGVGRNAPVLARLAKETGLRRVVPAGVYGRAHCFPRPGSIKSGVSPVPRQSPHSKTPVR